jgi:hypothetical protein
MGTSLHWDDPYGTATSVAFTKNKIDGLRYDGRSRDIRWEKASGDEGAREVAMVLAGFYVLVLLWWWHTL